MHSLVFIPASLFLLFSWIMFITEQHNFIAAVVSFDICAPRVFVSISMSIFEWMSQQMGFIISTAFQWHFLRKWDNCSARGCCWCSCLCFLGSCPFMLKGRKMGVQECCGLSPNRQPSPTQLLLTPHCGMGERESEGQNWGLVGWGKSSLII